MPPVLPREHEWTEYELHTALCLIVKGVHLEQRPDKRNDAPSITRAAAYENFYTALNQAVNGKDFFKDIHRTEVNRMLDQMLEDRKHVVGKGGLVERQRTGRVTRALRLAWNRYPAIDFDGTLSEWDQGRKEKVMLQYKIEQALLNQGRSKQGRLEAPAEAAVEGALEIGDTAMADVGDITRYKSWKESQLAVADTGRSRWPSKTDRGSESLAVQSPAFTQNNLESFRVLPENLRSRTNVGRATGPVAPGDNYARSWWTDRPLKQDVPRKKVSLRLRNVASTPTSREDTTTPNNLISRSANNTDNSRYSSRTSARGFINDSSTAIDMPPEVESVSSQASSNTRLRSSGIGSRLRSSGVGSRLRSSGVGSRLRSSGVGSRLRSSNQSSNDSLSKELEGDLAGELSEDIDMD